MADYELRELCADDIFIATKILSKIDLKELVNQFDVKSVKKLLKMDKPIEDTEEIDAEDMVEKIGLDIMASIGQVLLANISNCKHELYMLLAALSGMETEAIAKLPLGTFAKMIRDVVKQKGFMDFIKVVIESLK